MRGAQGCNEQPFGLTPHHEKLIPKFMERDKWIFPVRRLLSDGKKANEEILALEKGKGWKEAQDILQEHQDLYQKRDALRSEISERETKAREFRDVWIFTAFGAALIILGTVLYRSRAVWPGLSIIIAGFTIFEYWASPSFFSGASSEFHAVLVSKTVLTLVALIALYAVWRIMRTGREA
jgi:hypothetical protein